VYFIFQLGAQLGALGAELGTQLQSALNYEAYEAAQQIRAKRETVSMLCDLPVAVTAKHSARQGLKTPLLQVLMPLVQSTTVQSGL
jgi:hypothetical protein